MGGTPPPSRPGMGYQPPSVEWGTSIWTWDGGYTIQSWRWGRPHPVLNWGGYPIQSLGVPHPVLDGGYPHADLGWGYPSPVQTWDGVPAPISKMRYPPSGAGMGYPPPSRPEVGYSLCQQDGVNPPLPPPHPPSGPWMGTPIQTWDRVHPALQVWTD